jgi:hypothetical protein
MTVRPLLGVLLIFFATAACGQSPAPSPGGTPTASASLDTAAARASATILPEDMYARISFLAADSLAGRDTPSSGLETAAAYLTAEHTRFGLEPAGENGTFYQRFPFVPRVVPVGMARQQSMPPNIAAVLRGSDPVLRDEYVILSAHFDHVGTGLPVEGDSIYNGADDNASGTSALLEVAEALASMPQPPRRSVIFLHVSGEEHGLVGSRYYSDNPTVPVSRIIANINVDMIGRNSPDSIVVIGKNYSSLGPVTEKVGAEHPEIGLTISDDIWPEEQFFFRSDHYNFARLEIPSIFVFAGVHEDYHLPSDEVDKIDADKAARVARMIFHTVLEIANAPERPEWERRGLEEVRSMTR